MGTERISRPKQTSGPEPQCSGTKKQKQLRYSSGAASPPHELPQARGEFASRNLMQNPEMAAQVFGQQDCRSCTNVQKGDCISKHESSITQGIGQARSYKQNGKKEKQQNQQPLIKGLDLGFPLGGRPPDDCNELLRQIMRLVESLNIRTEEMLLDDWGLYEGNVGPDGSTWGGHQARYEREVEALEERYNKFNDTDDCDDYDMQYDEEVAYNEAYGLIGTEPPQQPAEATSRQDAINQILKLGGRIVSGVVIIGKGIGWIATKTIEALAWLIGLGVQRQH